MSELEQFFLLSSLKKMKLIIPEYWQRLEELNGSVICLV
jgi:hypothetical protein